MELCIDICANAKWISLLPMVAISCSSYMGLCCHNWVWRCRKGTSTVKYPTPLLYVSESDSKLYIDFEFCGGKYYKHLKSTLIYKVKKFMLTKSLFFQKFTYFTRECLNFAENMIKLHKIDECLQIYNEFKKREK